VPIRITCQHCGKGFSAWDDLVGKSVQCPKCQQSMIVRGAGGAGQGSAKASPGGAPAPTPTRRPRTADQGGSKQSPPATPQPVSPKPGPAKPPATKGPAAKPSAPRPPKAVPPAKPTHVGSPVESDDFDDREDLPFGCPKCNAEMEPDDDLCTACGYHLILKKVIDMEGIHRPDTSTGFDRVVKKHLDESESTAGMLLWAKFGGLFVLVLICFVCLGAWGLLIGLAVVIGYFIYRARLRIKAEDNPDAQVEPDPLAAIMWSAMLTVQRMIGWRALESPFGSLRVLTLRDASFTNDDLGQVEDLKQFEVLDLESTGITDGGLSHLKGRKKLRFLVVKNTAVTAAGVERLQQSVPAAWIWY
jgi:DNA-directed RNA polymerase subunit RPC12/RpoP